MKNQIPETLYDFSMFLISETNCISDSNALIYAIEEYMKLRGFVSKSETYIDTPDYNTIHNI